MRRLLIFAAGMMAVTAMGCGQKKITECNALVNVINGGVAALEKAPSNEGDPSRVSDLRAMADTMDKIAGDTAKIELTLPELKKVSIDYQKMAKDVAKAERDLAKAAEDKDTAKRAAAEAALDAAVKQEDPIVDGLNKFCQKP